MNEQFQKEHNERVEAENKAHNFVVQLCQEQNIELIMTQQGFSGHYEIPEIWTISKPICLVPNEYEMLKQHSVLQIESEKCHDGKACIEKFSRNGGWLTYEIS